MILGFNFWEVWFWRDVEEQRVVVMAEDVVLEGGEVTQVKMW